MEKINGLSVIIYTESGKEVNLIEATDQEINGALISLNQIGDKAVAIEADGLYLPKADGSKVLLALGWEFNEQTLKFVNCRIRCPHCCRTY